MMSPKLLISCLCVNPALFLLPIVGHGEYLAAVFSISDLSTYYLDIYWTRTKDSYSQIWQAQECELQRNIALYIQKNELEKCPGFRSISVTPFVSLSLHFQCQKFMTYQSMKY